MLTENPPTPDFLEYSRKLKLFSDNIEVKLPRSKEDRDKQLLEYMKFTKENTLIMSQIYHFLYFIKDDVESASEIRQTFTVQEILQLMKDVKALQASLRTAEVDESASV